MTIAKPTIAAVTVTVLMEAGTEWPEAWAMASAENLYCCFEACSLMATTTGSFAEIITM